MLTSFMRYAVAIILAIQFGLSASSSYAEKLAIEPDSYWLGFYAETPLTGIDHSPWDDFLARFLTIEDASWGKRINYSGITYSDENQLYRYIESLSSIDPRYYSFDEQLAYWINLYNAVTVMVVLENASSELSDLDDLYQRLGFENYQSAPLVTVAGRAVSLSDIQHKIVFPIWQDPQLHMLFSCATADCPELLSHAYSPQDVKKTGSKALRAHLELPQVMVIENDTLTISRGLRELYSAYENKDNFLRKLALKADDRVALKLLGFDGEIIDANVGIIRLPSSCDDEDAHQSAAVQVAYVDYNVAPNASSDQSCAP